MSNQLVATYLKLCLTLFLVSWSHILIGQFNWTNWFFGNENSTVGLTFTSEFADPIPSSARRGLDLSESNVMLVNTTVVTTYSNGKVALNNLGDIMPNGRDLRGSPSSLYGCTMADHPQFCEQYYLLYSEPEEAAAPRGVFYSVIDINIVVEGLFNNALGDIIPSQKDIRITPDGFDAAESIYSIDKSIPKEGSWLLLSERGSGDILVYDISMDGIALNTRYNLSDLAQRSSPEINNVIFDSYDIDHDHARVAIATNNKNLNTDSYITSFTFDKQVGRFIESSRQEVSSSNKFTYGLAFSRDGSKLYYSDHIEKTLHQFDFNTSIESLIATSSHNGKSGGLKRGPNHRIYWANRYNIEPNNDPISAISVIVEPNEAGQACNLQFNNVSIVSASLPTKIGVFPVLKNINISPFVLLQNDAECGEDNGAAIVIADHAVTPLSVQWDNGETTLEASNLSKGLHKVEMTTIDGCVYKDSIDIPELSDFLIEDFAYRSDNPTSCTELDGWISLSSPSFLMDSIYTISYTNNLGEIRTIDQRVNSDQQILIPDLKVGKYYDIGIGSNYTVCDFSVQDTITLSGFSEKPDLGMDTILCYESALTIGPNQEFDSYTWSDGSTSKENEISQSGNYILQVKDVNGCENSDSIAVLFSEDIDLELVQELVIESGESIQINPSINSEGDLNYNWTPPENLSCSDCLDPYASPTSSTSFQLIVTDENICADTSSINIKVNKYSGVYLPNIFTPNGGTGQDRFQIESGTIDVTEVKSFEIYDRWGEQVFEATNFDIADTNKYWNGKIGSEEASSGIYMYLVKIELDTGEVITQKGDILLVK